ncbi:hypothetical protein BDW02DRAFT_499831 [Decorospora gaudefroyi]|uniref:Mucin-7 n=1 Tax=Decorospora gaudefroyi TaxID=184978 RepID=A0A6A5KC27_9PLEO|nr:hypothetical protein BDW02DRAFT_499831 [Decorospora gaudefroyi]
MSNGVRNLRAMFENPSAASSPEPRGRSPTDYVAAADSDDRPKPKIRASFVSVEPTAAHASTDLGTTKGTPSNSISANRRESFSVNQENTEELAELKKVVSDEKEERRKSLAIPEAVPEQAVASRESSTPAPPIRNDPAGTMPNLGSIMKGSDFPDPSPRAEEEATAVPAPAAEVEEAKVEEAKVDETPAEPEQNAVETPEPIEATEPSPMPSPEPATAQPADNPDKAVTGAQEDLALRPATPTEETAAKEDAPVPEETAVEEDAAIEHEAATAAEPAENPDKVVTGVQEDVALRPAAPTDETAVLDEKKPSAPAEPVASSSEPAAETPKPAAAKAKPNGPPVTKKPEPTKPAAISTTRPSKALSASAKSPLPKSAPRTPTKPKATVPATKASPAAKAPKPVASSSSSKAVAPKEPVKAPVAKASATKAPATKTSRTSLQPAASSSSAAAPTASAAKPKSSAPPAENKKPVAAAKPAASAPRTRYMNTSPGGFKKPRPKSPTRPVGLPSRLTAPTAASAAKHGEEQKVTRKPSTTTRPAPKTGTARPPRPSVAHSVPKRPDSRTSTTSAAHTGGFLERMMRPTTASSSKTHDKPASPPRKASGATKPSVVQKGKKKAEEVTSKAKEAVTNGHGGDEHKAEDEAAKEADHTEQATEGATAEESSHEPHKAATPVQDVDSSAAELQTPHFEGETIR